MAKKKQKRKSKKIPVKANPGERSIVWPYVGMTLMVLLAIIIALGSFETGGRMPIAVFDGVNWLIGAAAFVLPIGLIFLAYTKFRNEEHLIPKVRLFALIGFFIALSSLFHVMFVKLPDINDVMATEATGGKGGQIGSLVGGAILDALDKIPAAILIGIISFVLLFLGFYIPFRILVAPFRKGDHEDTDLNDLKEKHFKLNAGVPTVGTPEQPEPPRPKPRLSSFRNSARTNEKSSSKSDEALITTSDMDWQFPGLNLLNQTQDKANAGDVNGNAEVIRETFNNFNIDVVMEGANIGPRVTQYTLRPPTGVKLTKITALENNLALDLAATSIRMEAPIPGKRLVGIEVPNIKSATVRLSSLLLTNEWEQDKSSSPLHFAIGKDISGKAVYGDLTKMPHILVAGQTGSGKSVMINTILTSLLYHNSPSDMKLILVDPKTVEMAPYNDIPHLLTPVITEPEKCMSALKWAVAEMERRYRTLAEVKKRNIGEYNALKKEESMPYIVIVIDELADLMMMAARDVEALIVRIAQKARAVGIHLILATQRPSVDVITGLIKANVPARIAFTTTSQVDSRTIIDQVGAEKLLGRGDMLYKTSEMPQPIRVQGSLIDDNETNKVTDFLREQREPQYDDEIVAQPVQFNGKGGIVAPMANNDADDDMWEDAVRVVIEGRKASTSLLQRRLRVGYARAARLIETMEEQGIVGQADGSRPREVLVSSMDDVFGDNNEEHDQYNDQPDVEKPEENYLAK